MFSRPSQQDTEDDLLKMQQQFLSSKTTPSAQVIRPGEKRKSPNADKPSSTEDAPSSSKHMATERDVVSLGDLPQGFAETSASTSVSQKERTAEGTKHREEIQMDTDPEAALDEHDSHITNVLKNIVEKESFPVYCPSAPVTGGFPRVLHRGNTGQKNVSTGKKKSLFAQQFASRSAQDFGLPKDYKRPPVQSPDPPTGKTVPVAGTVRERQLAQDVVGPGTSALPTAAGISATDVSGSDISEIQTENAAKLSAMTESEIMAEQKKLLQTLDPSVVSFLKKRGQTPDKPAGGSQPHTTVSAAAQTQSANSSSDSSNAMDTNELPVKPSKDWVHMDKLEGDKLAWIKDLPAPNTGDTKTGKSARFDFNGNLVGIETDVPTHLGLHHHGDEPERAGYTLEELFHLARSAHMQQRVLAINTLARIIHNTRRGRFHECVSTPLLPALVDGGLVVILRWALDDTTDNTMVAAVDCLHELLVTTEEEEALDRVFCWHRGHLVPCMCPPDPPRDEEDGEEPPEPSDSELLKQDLIKGLLKMSLLPRLRYILEVWRPPAAVVIQILDILIRIARHSPEAAYQISLCPRLMNTVFTEFLTWKVPDQWVEPLTVTYGRPCSRALKLVRVMCASGKNMATSMVAHHPLMDRIVVYISQDIHSDSHEELTRLVLESFRTWKVLAAYGLALVHFSEYYAVLMRQLQKLCSLPVDGANQRDLSQAPYVHVECTDSPPVQLGCTLLSFLETVTHTAANSTIETSRQLSRDRQSHNQPEEMEHTTSAAMPKINWSHVSGLYRPIQLCLHNGLEHFTKHYFTKKYSLSLLTSCLNFASSWLSRSENMPGYNAVEHLGQLEQLSDSFLLPLLESQGFADCLKHLRQESALLYTETSKRSEMLSSFPELGVFIGNKADICPVLSEESTVSFVLAFLRILSALRPHKGITEKVYSVLLENVELLQYVRKICQTKHSRLASNHFAMFENNFQEILLSLFKFKELTPVAPVYHQMSLCLLTHITEGNEYLVHNLLSNVVFNKDFLHDAADDMDQSAQLLDERLRIHERADLSSATRRSVSINNTALLSDTLSALSSVRNTYLTTFSGFQQALDKSRRRCEETSGVPDSLVLGRCGQTLVPIDWAFSPLVSVYNSTAATTSQSGVEGNVSPATIAMVINSLRWVYLLETCRPSTLESVSGAIRFSRVVCTFLAGSDLFLDAGVQCCLAALLKVYCMPVYLDRMDFSKSIPGLSSFYDLYVMLLDQYGAVSFGDSVFGCYLLLPLQQRHSVLLRRAVWGEHSHILRSLLIPIREVAVPLQRFLEPEETHVELIRLYFEALCRGSVSPRWCPLPYMIAIHHVNRFLYTQGGKHAKLRRAMARQILATPNQTVRHHLIHYKMADEEHQLGMCFYDNLPSIRLQFLAEVEKS